MSRTVATSRADVDSCQLDNDSVTPCLASLNDKISVRTKWIKGFSIAIIAMALVVIIRTLPVDRVIDLLKIKVESMGFWGPIVFGVLYVVSALAFFPGSALTMAAGAVFGLAWGTLTVSLASTTAASLAFLVARYLARDKVTTYAQRMPKFQAIDGAIGVGSWKIIALLRLSPIIPFSLGNYLYGLTAIRFWPYIFASWLFMLPGTFMYVYLGHIGMEGIRSTAKVEGGKSPIEWSLLGIGLLATFVVTIYISRLSSNALRKQNQIEKHTIKHENPSLFVEKTNDGATNGHWGATMLAVVAVAMLIFATYVNIQRDSLKNLFGPAPVTLHEAYRRDSEGPQFDHSLFDTLLHKYVDQDGWIDYGNLLSDTDSLDTYIANVKNAPFVSLGRDEKLALLINAYNAFTLRLILDYYPLKSIKDIPNAKRWDAKRWQIGFMTLSLNQIEHEQIRPKFAEPRIHFALVCAAIGCPKLRNEAYHTNRLEEQLEDQTRYVHTHDRWFRYQQGAIKIQLTKLYSWYGSDFKQVAGSILDYAAGYSAHLKTDIDAGKNPRIKWLEYDWTLNDRKNNH